MGTPEFAIPALAAVRECCELVAVVAQPDRPQGRGQRSARPPTARWAEERGLAILQPEKVRTPEFLSALSALAPEIVIVVAYGRILPRAVLDLPARGCLNVHASLLPRYRGAAPIQWAIARGESETGVTLMQMEEGLDSGPVLLQRSCPIDPDETGEALATRLSILGADLLREGLPLLVRGALVPAPQDTAQVTLAPPLTREDAWLDFTRPARELHDRVRAFQPWPAARCALPGGATIKILRTAVAEGNGPPGQLLAAGRDGLLVGTGLGALRLLELQPEGRRRMQAGEFLAGHPIAAGSRLGGRAAPPPVDV